MNRIGKNGAKLSRDTIRKIEFIQYNAAEEVKQKLREGKTTISKEYLKILNLAEKTANS